MKNYSKNSTPTKHTRIPSKFEINSSTGKKVVASFDGGLISSDAGAVLLSAAEEKLGIVSTLAGCIKDRRAQGKIIHTLEDMLTQRIIQVACGYEDLNDSAQLLKDPILKLIGGRTPQKGRNLASAPTLCRFENSITRAELLKMGSAFIERFIQSRKNKPPKVITIDLDATDDKTHGQQEFSFYHGYYRCYCFLPLVVTASCDDSKEFAPISAILRPGNVHASNGAITVLRRVFDALKKAFPAARIIIRGDCGFSVPEIYNWLEERGIKYVIGMPRNSRLMELGVELRRAAGDLYEEEGEKVRIFEDYQYAAFTWKKPRRIIYKAERMPQGENNRFVVTNIEDLDPQDIYDGLYVRRGEMENRIKELKNGLFMDRTSCSGFLTNQFRVLLSLAAFLLFQEIRRHLKGTGLENAQTPTIRARLLKIGALVKETARKIFIHFSSAFALQKLFWRILNRLRGSPIPL